MTRRARRLIGRGRRRRGVYAAIALIACLGSGFFAVALAQEPICGRSCHEITVAATPPKRLPSAAALPERSSIITVGGPLHVRPVGPGFLGLSIEYYAVQKYAGRDPHALNPVFLQLVRNLNPRQSPVIRIGGDSADWASNARTRRGGLTRGRAASHPTGSAYVASEASAIKLSWCQELSVPEDVSSRWEVLDLGHEFVAVPLVKAAILKRVGEVDGLRAPASLCLGFGGGNEPSGESAPPETWVHPKALQLATVTPGPSADSGYDRAIFTDEDRQIHFVTKSHGDGRLTTDLRFEEL
jgi:hypothetical protein